MEFNFTTFQGAKVLGLEEDSGGLQPCRRGHGLFASIAQYTKTLFAHRLPLVKRDQADI